MPALIPEGFELMSLAPLTKTLIERKLQKYCEQRIPEHAKSSVRITFKFFGAKVTLWEERPAFSDPTVWIGVVFAQFRFNSITKKWTLYCADRNSRWHKYIGVEPTEDFKKLLKEVDRDPTGIFWG